MKTQKMNAPHRSIREHIIDKKEPFSLVGICLHKAIYLEHVTDYPNTESKLKNKLVKPDPMYEIRKQLTAIERRLTQGNENTAA
jgi:hypothetical protein